MEFRVVVLFLIIALIVIFGLIAIYSPAPLDSEHAMVAELRTIRRGVQFVVMLYLLAIAVSAYFGYWSVRLMY